MDALKSWPCKMLLVAGTVLLAAAVVGCGPASERKPAMTLEEACQPVYPKEDPRVARVRRALRTPIDVAFDKTPLDQALKVIGEKAGVAVIPAPDLATYGIDISSRYVLLDVNSMPADEVLHLVLSGDMAYVVEGDRVLVTTREVALHKTPCVFYPVADLVHSGAPESHIDSVGLADIIKRTVNNMADPKVAAWAEEGGPAAIYYYDGVLIVTQTPEGHERIAEFFALLREGLARVERQLQE